MSSNAGKLALLKRFRAQLAEWGPLLQRFLRSEDDQVGRRRREAQMRVGGRWCPP